MKFIEIMGNAKFVKLGSKMIFVCDLSGLEVDDALKVLKRAEDIIKRMPKRSVLAVARLTNVKYNEEIEVYIRHLIEQSDPHVLKGAVTGVTDKRLRVEIDDLMASLGKNKETFDTYEDAVSWLLA